VATQTFRFQEVSTTAIRVPLTRPQRLTSNSELAGVVLPTCHEPSGRQATLKGRRTKQATANKLEHTDDPHLPSGRCKLRHSMTSGEQKIKEVSSVVALIT
jgi:hypothetical protein